MHEEIYTKTFEVKIPVWLWKSFRGLLKVFGAGSTLDLVNNFGSSLGCLLF